MKYKINQLVQCDGEDVLIIAYDPLEVKEYTVILQRNGTKHRRSEYELSLIEKNTYKRKSNFV